ncbi:MAG: hypothetical protein U5L96_21490 [Owenweeksia sp.]|nr:hypothetical protein [Owenweeksia sp.]
MPGQNGLEVIDSLRKSNSASAQSKIILCTANAMIRNSNSEILEKLDATLLKPFKEYEVAAMLAGLDPDDSQ